jgi:hypothetical protein
VNQLDFFGDDCAWHCVTPSCDYGPAEFVAAPGRTAR